MPVHGGGIRKPTAVGVHAESELTVRRPPADGRPEPKFRCAISGYHRPRGPVPAGADETVLVRNWSNGSEVRRPPADGRPVTTVVHLFDLLKR